MESYNAFNAKTIDDLPGMRCAAALAVLAELRRNGGHHRFRIGLRWLDQAINDLAALGRIRTTIDVDTVENDMLLVEMAGGKLK
jgi:hypothetical protein